MGILNVTPDSFSDGGKYSGNCAIERGLNLFHEGADIVDVGGESSRPGAIPVSLDEELSRVIPVVDALAKNGIPVSVDTTKREVMQAALDSGASMINDIHALQGLDKDFLAKSDAAVCLMHMKGNPMTMQLAPSYNSVVDEIKAFLIERIEAAASMGIAKERLLIDPGFGFGKTLEQNLELVRHLDAFRETGIPVLAGLSRKSMLGAITGRAVNERIHASVAASLLAVAKGASVVRVHDVAATKDALVVYHAIEGKKWEEDISARTA